MKYSTFDIVKGLGIARERLREWMTRGFVVPSVQADGVGTKALFSIEDVYRVELFKELLAVGFNRISAEMVCMQISNKELTQGSFVHLNWVRNPIKSFTDTKTGRSTPASGYMLAPVVSTSGDKADYGFQINLVSLRQDVQSAMDSIRE